MTQPPNDPNELGETLPKVEDSADAAKQASAENAKSELTTKEEDPVSSNREGIAAALIAQKIAAATHEELPAILQELDATTSERVRFTGHLAAFSDEEKVINSWLLNLETHYSATAVHEFFSGINRQMELMGTFTFTVDQVNFLWVLEKNYPKKAEALKRDIARLKKRKNARTTEKLPEVDTIDWEDPFGMGVSYMAALAKYKPDKNSQDIKKFFDPKQSLVQSLRNLSNKVVASDQFDIAVTVFDALPKATGIDNPNPLDAKDFIEIWDNYRKKISKGLPIDMTLDLLALSMPTDTDDTTSQRLFDDVLGEYTQRKSVKSDHSNLFYASITKVKEIQTALQHPNIFNYFVRLVKEGDSRAAAFAITQIDGACRNQSQAEKLSRITPKFFKTPADFENPVATARFRVILEAAEPSEETIGAALEALTKNHGPLYELTGRKTPHTPELLRTLVAKYPVFRFFDKQLIQKKLEAIFAAQAPSQKFFEKIERGTKLPADFDKAKAVWAMRNHTSLPLVEPTSCDTKEILPKAFSVRIQPNPARPKELACWQMVISFLNFDNNTISNETIVLDFDRGALITPIQDKKTEATVEALGIHIANLYYVKQEAEGKIPKPEDKKSGKSNDKDDDKEEKDNQGELQNTPLPGPSKLDQIAARARAAYNRAQRSLRLNFREVYAQEEKEERQAQQLTATFAGNKLLIARALNGETLTEKELDEIIIHREKKHQLPTGEQVDVHERVPVDEIKTAIKEGTLATQPWLFLDVSPHTKALGYFKAENKIGAQGFVNEKQLSAIVNTHGHVDPAKINIATAQEIWTPFDCREQDLERGTPFLTGAEFIDTSIDGLKAKLTKLQAEGKINEQQAEAVIALHNSNFAPSNTRPLLSLTPIEASETTDIRYLYHLEAGLPEVSDFKPREAPLVIELDAKNRIGNSIVTAGNDLFEAIHIERDFNAQLAHRISAGSEILSTSWFLLDWVEAQTRELLDEIDEIEKSNLSSEAKDAAKKERQEKLNALPRLAEKMGKETRVVPSKIQSYVKLAVALAMTNMGFNSGKFRPLTEVLTAA